MPRRPPCWNLSTKRRIRLVVAYDGYDFCGWAPQDGLRTVRGILTEAVRQISGEENEIIAASRTDSGAHAVGQVCHFDTRNPMPSDRWPLALNQLLPSDVVVKRSDLVPNRFHSRFWADKRWYRYRILTGQRDPHRARTTWFTPQPQNVERMNEAAARFLGVHDFLAFSQELPPGTNTTRELRSVEVRRLRDEIVIDVHGNAFLRGMMRRISGTLWEIGRGKREPEWVSELLAMRDRETIPWPTVLPAHGLCLMRVFYGRHPLDKRQFIDESEED